MKIPNIGIVNRTTPTDRIHAEWAHKLTYARYDKLGKGLTYVPKEVNN